MQSYELKLNSGKVEVVQMGTGQEPPYTVYQMGIYLVVDTHIGLVLLWDRKTSLFLRLSPEFKVRSSKGGHCHQPHGLCWTLGHRWGDKDRETQRQGDRGKGTETERQNRDRERGGGERSTDR